MVREGARCKTSTAATRLPHRERGMGKRNESMWTERLRAIGVKGKLPSVLTQGVVDAAQARPLGFQYSLADGSVRGLSLAVRENGSAGYVFEYRNQADQHRRHGLGSAQSITLAQARAD